MGWRNKKKTIIITLEFLKFKQFSDRNKKYRCTKNTILFSNDFSFKNKTLKMILKTKNDVTNYVIKK